MYRYYCKIPWNFVVYDIWKQVNILTVTLLFDMCHFLLQLFNRSSVATGLKTLCITIFGRQEKWCASGAYYRKLDNLRGTLPRGVSMVAGSGKIWNPSRSSAIAYSESFLPLSLCPSLIRISNYDLWVDAIRASGWILIIIINWPIAQFFKNLTVFLWSGGVKAIPATRPRPLFCLQIPQFPTSACSVLLSMLFTHLLDSQLFLVNCKDPALWRLLMENWLN
jgi:hypothetical protein